MKISIGKLGEQLVGKWLESKNYRILYYRWHCRWGEIDIIAKDESNLLFIEVKTRSKNNWDNYGRESIALNKQKKIYTTANVFLSKNPQLANSYCRFDVGLVGYQKYPEEIRSKFLMTDCQNGYNLYLLEYLENAFE